MREIRSARIARMILSAALIALALVAPVARSQTPPPPSSEQPKAKETDTAKDKEKATPKEKDTAKAAPGAKVSKKSRTKPGDEVPLVMSSSALAKARGKDGDKGRYDGEPDWAQIPPWRQASFFGIRVQGQLIIYVVDCSGSMDEEDRLDRAKAELRRSVNAMQAPQRFKVIFYNDRPVPMPGELPKSADYLGKDQLSRWLHMVQPFGGTDPRSSLSLALAYRPDAIFLLSDGDFPDGTVESVAKLNSKKVPIHCVDMANGAAGDGLRQIAAESGGQYVAKGR